MAKQTNPFIRASLLLQAAFLSSGAVFVGSSVAQDNRAPALEAGHTRVYFAPGYHVGMGWRPNLKAVQILSSDSVITNLAEGQYAIVDFKAGNYTIGCVPQEANANFPVARQITFKAGTYKYFSCDMDAFTETTRAKEAAVFAVLGAPLGAVGGLIGGAISGAAAGASSPGDFRTKTSLEERPLSPDMQYAGYVKVSDTPNNKDAGNDSTSADPASQLKELQSLKKQGLITDTEYRTKRKSILDNL
jgi:hypothetical protein